MTSIDRCYETLELPPGSSLDQIKQAYRDLAQIWHPDRYAHNPRLRSKAEERFKAINEAYQNLISQPRSSHRSETSPPMPRPSQQRSSHGSETPPPIPHPTESRANTGPPTPPTAGIKPPTRNHWGWTILTIFSFAVIRSCYNASQSSGSPNNSYQTFQPGAPPSIATSSVRNPTIPPSAEKPLVAQTTPPSVARLLTDVSAGPPGDKSTTPESTPPIQAPPKSRAVPEREFKQLTLSFTSPGPVAHGTVRNNTEWFITGGSVIVRRQYAQIDTGVPAVHPPDADTHRFELKIPGDVIPPFTTAEIAVDIGHYLDSYDDGTWNNLPVTFSATSRVTIDSLRGYPQ